MKNISFSEAANLCNAAQQPIPVSVNGNEIIYLMNEKLYKEYLEAQEFEAVMQGFEDIKNGRYLDGDTFFEEMHRKYGI